MSQELIGYIYDIQKFSVHDGPGIRTDVFLKGCPLSCIWCHSPESQAFGSDLAWMDIRCIGTELCGLCLKACRYGALSKGEPVKSVTGGDVIFPVIDREKCKVCLACAEACPSKALYNTGARLRGRLYEGDTAG
jgi:pyruvate formate lyase activating enzyme